MQLELIKYDGDMRAVAIRNKLQNITPDNKIERLLRALENEPNNARTEVDILGHKNLLSKDPHLAIVDIIGILHQRNRELNSWSGSNERKHFGIYYTNCDLATFIVEQTLELQTNDFTAQTFLEPCAGTGNFAIAYLNIALTKTIELSAKKIQKIVDNIFLSDIDPEAIDLAKKIIRAFIKGKFGYDVKLKENNFYTGDALYEKGAASYTKVDLRHIFGRTHGFDVVITNPPYKLLKENRDIYGENHDSDIASLIRKIRAEKQFSLNTGTLNLYKLFIEEIVIRLTTATGRVGLLVPRSLLNDKQSEKLRDFIFYGNKSSTIFILPEQNTFFPDVSQSFCFFGISKSELPAQLSVVDKVNDLESLRNEAAHINISSLRKISNSIIVQPQIGLRILEKIHCFPSLKKINSIKNLRGELDLTLHKKFILNQTTDQKLLRGVHIQEYSHSEGVEYVADEFLREIGPKAEHINMERLACQQISNIGSKKRLKFSLVPKKKILGNSCNYITLLETDDNARIKKLGFLLVVLNSFLLDWRFKLTNSNNHIGNYELDELPIALNEASPDIDDMVKIALHASSGRILSEDEVADINYAVFRLYGLTEHEARHVMVHYNQPAVSRRILEKYAS